MRPRIPGVLEIHSSASLLAPKVATLWRARGLPVLYRPLGARLELCVLIIDPASLHDPALPVVLANHRARRVVIIAVPSAMTPAVPGALLSVVHRTGACLAVLAGASLERVWAQFAALLRARGVSEANGGVACTQRI